MGDLPHRMSGGMRQRAMVALALAGGPRLLVADEPTTALDVTIQAQILELLLRLRDELGLAVLLVTHDLGIVAEVADRALVMYAGEIVEEAPVERLLSAPEHPYTRALLAVASRRGGGGGPGEAPGDRRHRARAGGLAPGLPLRAALPGRLRPLRRRAPRRRRPSADGRVACFLGGGGPLVTGAAAAAGVRPEPLLSVRGLAKAFRSLPAAPLGRDAPRGPRRLRRLLRPRRRRDARPRRRVGLGQEHDGAARPAPPRARRAARSASTAATGSPSPLSDAEPGAPGRRRRLPGPGQLAQPADERRRHRRRAARHPPDREPRRAPRARPRSCSTPSGFPRRPPSGARASSRAGSGSGSPSPGPSPRSRSSSSSTSRSPRSTSPSARRS